jgi:hypothetical protein
MTVSSDPREAAREWIAQTLRTHLHPSLHPAGGEDRIKEVAAMVEAESFREGWPIETAIELAIEWAELRNQESGVCDASHN